MENVLKKIINKKKEKLKNYKKIYSTSQLLRNIKNISNFTDFKKEIIKRNFEKKISIIAEIKKASPSAGLLVKNFNPLIIKVFVLSSMLISGGF